MLTRTLSASRHIYILMVSVSTFLFPHRYFYIYISKRLPTNSTHSCFFGLSFTRLFPSSLFFTQFSWFLSHFRLFPHPSMYICLYITDFLVSPDYSSLLLIISLTFRPQIHVLNEKETTFSTLDLYEKNTPLPLPPYYNHHCGH